MDPTKFGTANFPVNKGKNRLVNILPCTYECLAYLGYYLNISMRSFRACRSTIWLELKYSVLCIVKHTAASVFVKTVVTVESSRVALQQIRGVEGSDYINASYIDVSLAQLIPYEHCILQHYMHCVRCRSVLVQSWMDTCCLLNLWWIFFFFNLINFSTFSLTFNCVMMQHVMEAQQMTQDGDTTPPHHNRFTALFPGPPGWASARRELLDFMVQGEINGGRWR